MQTAAQKDARLKILDLRNAGFARFSENVETSIKLNRQRTHSLECAKFVSWHLGHFLFIALSQQTAKY